MKLPPTLEEAALGQGPAVEANERIYAMRERFAGETGAGYNYEIILDGRPDNYLMVHVAPRLALYLKSKKMRVASCSSLFLSIFTGQRLFFVSATDFYAYIKSVGGFSNEVFASLAEGWEKTGRSSIAALPSAEPTDA